MLQCVHVHVGGTVQHAISLDPSKVDKYLKNFERDILTWTEVHCGAIRKMNCVRNIFIARCLWISIRSLVNLRENALSHKMSE